MTVRKRELLYILAPSFSGSTLLTYLLAQHPEIATVGELKATQMGPVDEYYCSCGSRIVECPFWSAVQREAKDEDVDFSLDRFGTVFRGSSSFSDKIVGATVRGMLFESVRAILLQTMPGVAAQLETVALRNKQITDIVCGIQSSRIFLDGSKDATRLLHLMRAGYWDVKVIYLQRDGRGVSSSIKSHEKIEFSSAVDEWIHNTSELQQMRNRLSSSQVFDLRYEDLCNQPTRQMQALWEWLRLPQFEIQESHFKNGDYHILGNAMRLSNVSEILLDEKWKKLLSENEIQYFESRAGALNRQLGYV